VLKLRAGAIIIGLSLLAAGTAGCTSRAQQWTAMTDALSGRFLPDGPVMANDAEPVGTHEPELAHLSSDSASDITVISASLIALPGFRTPRLLSTGIVAGRCPETVTALPSAQGHSITVTVNGHSYQPLHVHGYSTQIGAGCVPQIVYVIQATSAGQYAVGGLRILLRHDGKLQTLFSYDGVDVWFYGAGPYPTPQQVDAGLRSAFAAQVTIYHDGGSG
jgi:hypothetical protein